MNKQCTHRLVNHCLRQEKRILWNAPVPVVTVRPL